MYQALDVANYIVKVCNDKEKYLNVLKLQKILYFVQAEFLVVKQKPCFLEDIEKSSFGPVVLTVYQKYKVYTSNFPHNLRIGKIRISKEDKELINKTVDECLKYSSTALADIIYHQEPWIKAYENQNKVILNEDIKAFFEKQYVDTPIGKMRNSTSEEDKSVDQYIKSISKCTNVNFWDLL